MKRITKANKKIIIPYLDRLINEIPKIEQASTQWTLSQLFLALEKELTDQQKEKALLIMKGSLSNHSDWIVLNQTMDTLGEWAWDDEQLGNWLKPHMERLSRDSRKSVQRKAERTLILIEKVIISKYLQIL